LAYHFIAIKHEGLYQVFYKLCHCNPLNPDRICGVDIDGNDGVGSVHSTIAIELMNSHQGERAAQKKKRQSDSQIYRACVLKFRIPSHSSAETFGTVRGFQL
jgi:hypothetical protein